MNATKTLNKETQFQKGLFFLYPFCWRLKQSINNENEENTWPTVRRVQDWHELRLELAPKTWINQTRLLKTTQQ